MNTRQLTERDFDKFLNNRSGIGQKTSSLLCFEIILKINIRVGFKSNTSNKAGGLA